MTKRSSETVAALARNLRNRRKALGLSQREVAAAAELDPAALSRLENGRAGVRGVGLERVDRLAKALKSTPSELLAP